MTAILISTITCPACGLRTAGAMPTNGCVRFWRCPGCGAVLAPKPGDCCVYCSYGDVPCPPIQTGGGCGDPESPPPPGR